jgi:cullin 1
MLDTYQDHFHVPLVKATMKYYRIESEDFIANNSVSDYMKKAEARLAEETDRVNMYLHDSSRRDVSVDPGSR